MYRYHLSKISWKVWFYSDKDLFKKVLSSTLRLQNELELDSRPPLGIHLTLARARIAPTHPRTDDGSRPPPPPPPPPPPCSACPSPWPTWPPPPSQGGWASGGPSSPTTGHSSTRWIDGIYITWRLTKVCENNTTISWNYLVFVYRGAIVSSVSRFGAFAPKWRIWPPSSRNFFLVWRIAPKAKNMAHVTISKFYVVKTEYFGKIIESLTKKYHEIFFNFLIISETYKNIKNMPFWGLFVNFFFF